MKSRPILWVQANRHMKFNWGTGIALFYICFAVGMIALVMATRSHDPGLVQKDYYALDLNYQDRLDRKQNTAALVKPPQLWVLNEEKQLKIQFPEDMGNCIGKAKFYRSSTTKDDFLLDIPQEKTMPVNTEKMAAGRWHVEMEWEASGTKYFWETAFII